MTIGNGLHIGVCKPKMGVYYNYMEQNTAKHFVLQLGSLVSLYLSLSFLLVLLFGIINLVLPNAAESYYNIDDYSRSVRLGIAMVVVFFPTYIVLTRTVNRLRRESVDAKYLSLTKWLLYLSLLIGGGILLGDLATVIMTFLSGDITERFIFKATSVLVIIGLAFHYYLQDARGVWVKNEQKSIMFGVGATIAVCVAVVYGFAHIETPAVVQAMKLDEKQVQDLQLIQSTIESVMLISSSTLPATLEDAFNGFPVPLAPQDRPTYRYEITATGFKLCATFSSDSQPGMFNTYSVPVDITRPIKNPENWQYKAGDYCFDRIVSK